MQQGITHKEAVRLAREAQERAALDRSGQAVYDKIERLKAENPEEAKKIAATLKRREAARRKKQGPAQTPLPEQSPESRPDVPSAESKQGKAEADMPGI